MSELVLYHPEKDQLKLYRLGVPFYQKDHWLGEPFLVWRSLEIAIEHGWIVIGDL